jgi:hypothetical protein
MFWSEQQCMYVRGRIEHPEKYVCQVFRGPKEIDWEFKPGATTPDHAEGNPVADPSPAEEQHGSLQPEPDLAKYHDHYQRQRGSFIDVAVGPSELAEKDAPSIEPRAIAPKRVQTAGAIQRRHQHPQFDPIGALVAFFTPRADW